MKKEIAMHYFETYFWYMPSSGYVKKSFLLIVSVFFLFTHRCQYNGI